jgi:hypothetical protein
MFKILMQFICDKGILRQIHPSGMEDQTEWQWIPYGRYTTVLAVREESKNKVIFTTSELTFDLSQGRLEFEGEVHDLKRIK